MADPCMGEWIKRRIKGTIDLFCVDLGKYLDTARDDSRGQKTGKMTAQVEDLEGAGADEKTMKCIGGAAKSFIRGGPSTYPSSAKPGTRSS